MVVKITYFVHGTTTDNETNKSTGWNPGELSYLGIKQSRELKEIIKDKKFDTVFSSDLKRAVDSARITFGENFIQDKRLRECNYGDLNWSDEDKVDYNSHIDARFPNGECNKDVEKRIRSFLSDILTKYDGKHIAIVGHKSPQLALEVVLNGKTWEQAIKEDWRHTKAWQPGWVYEVSEEML